MNPLKYIPCIYEICDLKKKETGKQKYMCLEDVVLIVQALQKAMSSFRNSPIISLAHWFISLFKLPLPYGKIK